MEKCTCGSFGLSHAVYCPAKVQSEILSEEKNKQPLFESGNIVIINFTNIEATVLSSNWDILKNMYAYSLIDRNGNQGWCFENELKFKKVLLKD